MNTPKDRLVIGVDVGPDKSGYVYAEFTDEAIEIISRGHDENASIRELVRTGDVGLCVIELPSFRVPNAERIATCLWAGRYAEMALDHSMYTADQARKAVLGKARVKPAEVTKHVVASCVADTQKLFQRSGPHARDALILLLAEYRYSYGKEATVRSRRS